MKEFHMISNEDKERLRVIARAAGYWYEPDIGECATTPDGYFKPWNPLNDNGDAFKLALDMDISYRLDRSFPNGELIVIATCDTGNIIWGDQEICSNDKCAATRRVICRLAEEIGQDLLSNIF